MQLPSITILVIDIFKTSLVWSFERLTSVDQWHLGFNRIAYVLANKGIRSHGYISQSYTNEMNTWFMPALCESYAGYTQNNTIGQDLLQTMLPGVIRILGPKIIFRA